MIVFDVNVLVAAHMADHPHHEKALGFLKRSLTTDSVIVPDAVWTGFLRIVTHPRVFERPSTMTAASAFVRDVCASERYRAVAGLTDGLDVLLTLCVDADVSANLIPDAYIAAVAISHGCPVATFDRDFRRFDGLEVVAPE